MRDVTTRDERVVDPIRATALAVLEYALSDRWGRVWLRSRSEAPVVWARLADVSLEAILREADARDRRAA